MSEIDKTTEDIWKECEQPKIKWMTLEEIIAEYPQLTEYQLNQLRKLQNGK